MRHRIEGKSRHFFYMLTGFIGMFLMVWVYSVYKLTFIPLPYTLLIILVVTAGSTLLHYHQFKTTYTFSAGTSFVLTVLWSLLSWGFICISLFLFTNYYLASGQITRKEFNILNRAEQPGIKGEREKLRPAFTIDYQGMEKDLLFANRFYKWKDDYKTVILSLQEGKWGFEVIKGKAVTK